MRSQTADRAASRHRSQDRTRNRARFRLEGLEDRCLLSGISAITEFNLPSGNFSGNSSGGITTGPDRQPLVHGIRGQRDRDDQPDDRRHQPSSPPPPPGPVLGGSRRGLTATSGSPSKLPSKIGMINPTTDAITEFAIPTASSGSQDITAGPDGNLWFTENAANKVGMINPTTHAITEFAIPTKNSGPWGITLGAGRQPLVYRAMELQDRRDQPRRPTPSPSSRSLRALNRTRSQRGPNGNLWFGVWGFIAEINPTTHVITQFATPSGNGAMGITAGPDGDIWFTEAYVVHPENIDRIDPTTGAVTEYPALAPVFQALAITTGPDGNLWFTDRWVLADPIGVATLSSSQLVVTQPPPSSITAGTSFGLTVQAEDS